MLGKDDQQPSAAHTFEKDDSGSYAVNRTIVDAHSPVHAERATFSPYGWKGRLVAYQCGKDGRWPIQLERATGDPYDLVKKLPSEFLRQSFCLT